MEDDFVSGVVPVLYPVRSWGKMLTATTVATNDSIEIAMQKIPLVSATYIEGVSDTQVSRMMKMGIDGMTGNELFLHPVLVPGTQNKKFSLVTGR